MSVDIYIRFFSPSNSLKSKFENVSIYIRWPNYNISQLISPIKPLGYMANIKKYFKTTTKPKIIFS